MAAGVATTSGVVATRYFLPGVDDAALDTYRQSDVEFIAQLGMPGAMDVVPSTLKEAITMSSVVLVGEIADVRPTEPVTGEVRSDKVYGLGMVVRPLEVIQGSLPLRFRDELTIDLLHGETHPASGLDEVRERRPKGPVVFFLRSGEDAVNRFIDSWKKEGKPVPGGTARLDRDRQYYGLVSYHGILVQGPDHVVGPAGDPEWASVGMAREASAYPTLSELVAYLRILDSVPVGTNIG